MKYCLFYKLKNYFQQDFDFELLLVDMSGIRKYFDHQDGWGADWVKCVVELSTKGFEVFTASPNSTSTYPYHV